MYQLTMDDTLMLLLYNDDILILTHKKPDGDTLGSGTALCHALRAKGKRAFVKDTGEITEKYRYLCSGLFPPADFEPKFIVSVDTADLQLFSQNCKEYSDKVDLSIDHHPSNSGFAGHTYMEAQASATGEIIYGIVSKLKIALTPAIMEGIYIAVSTDTGCFKYANTTVLSHLIGAKAMECGVEIGAINKLLFETKTKARVAIEGHLYEQMVYHFGGRVAVSCLERKDIDEIAATEDDLDNISAILRAIVGIECAVTLIQQKSGDYKMSVRSGDLVDASKVCALFGGGGHNRAAGCTIKSDSFQQDVAQVVATIGEMMDV